VSALRLEWLKDRKEHGQLAMVRSVVGSERAYDRSYRIFHNKCSVVYHMATQLKPPNARQVVSGVVVANHAATAPFTAGHCPAVMTYKSASALLSFTKFTRRSALTRLKQ